MKRLMWLLAMYVLVLMGLPCPDSDCYARAAPAVETPAAGTPAAGVPTSHDETRNHEAPCSPFCHCATCVGFTVPQPLVSVLPSRPSSLLPMRRAFAYQPILPEDVAYPFWQPPKR